MRAQKFGVGLSVDAKKEARAARFGVSAPINTGNTAVSIIGSDSVAVRQVLWEVYICCKDT
jgi:hypothetical protein